MGRPRGGKVTVPKRTLDAYADSFLQRPSINGKIVDTPSREAIKDIYRRVHGVSASGRGLTYQERRAAAAELATIERKAARSDVIALEVVPPINKARTPDLRLLLRGKPELQRVETFALTQATRSRKPVLTEQAPCREAKPSALVDAVRSKARDTPSRPSQIRGGGEIVGNVMFKVFDQGAFAAEADAAMVQLGPELRNQLHVNSIELVGIEARTDRAAPGVRTVLRYERNSTGSFSRVSFQPR